MIVFLLKLLLSAAAALVIKAGLALYDTPLPWLVAAGIAVVVVFGGSRSLAPKREKAVAR